MIPAEVKGHQAVVELSHQRLSDRYEIGLLRLPNNKFSFARISGGDNIEVASTAIEPTALIPLVVKFMTDLGSELSDDLVSQRNALSQQYLAKLGINRWGALIPRWEEQPKAGQIVERDRCSATTREGAEGTKFPFKTKEFSLSSIGGRINISPNQFDEASLLLCCLAVLGSPETKKLSPNHYFPFFATLLSEHALPVVGSKNPPAPRDGAHPLAPNSGIIFPVRTPAPPVDDLAVLRAVEIYQSELIEEGRAIIERFFPSSLA
jgi:hypothetical protein